MLQLPSQLQNRSTYATPASAGVQATAPAAPGFELGPTLILTQAALLPLLSAAFHESCPIGSYLLLLDQIKSAQNPALLAVDGDLAILTLGPTLGAGATSLLSESVTEAPTIVPDPTCAGRYVEIRGFPFDVGCVAVVSSTPGRVTQLPAVNASFPPGARITARRQY